MKSSKGFISFLLALTMSLGTAVALTSCGSNKKDDSSSNQTQQFDDLGEYYCIVGESEWSLNVTGDQFILTVNGQAKNGEYTFDGETLSVKFTDGALATATVEGGVMTLDYDGATYKLYKKVNYTVTFETNDGSAVESGKVINGQSVAKPADPTKDGFVFIGWYEDSTFKTPYVFAKPVTSDMTLYARFVKSPTNPAEFTVKFVVDGNEAYNTELPTPEKEGATFVGWWMSDFEDANKLTAKYTEQVLGEHTTLYAVWADDKANVSVGDKEITWTAAGVNNSYKVVVKNAAGEELLSRNTSTPKVAFDFAQQPAGEYTVEVSFSGKTTTAYYNNKALDKVCIFAVTDSTVTFNAVANAKKYLITVDCANDEHQHTDLDIGTSTYYNFDACDMQVGGIKFTVKAVADGYTTSTSETFSVERTLNQVTDLTVDNATETATWSAVENATAYAIKIENAGNVIEKTITETSYSLKGMTGEIIISVYPMGKGFNPAAAASYTYNNVRLAVPSGLKLAGQSLAWDAVAGAAKYNVKIGANVFEAATNSLALTDAHFPDGLDTYAVSVQAIASEAEKNSLYSDEITINCNKMSDTVAYSNGGIVWDYVLGASKYGVKVNDGEEIFVDGASNTCAITLTQAGENTIYVRSYDATNEATDWVSVKVSANAITFATEGEAVAPMYKVNGDTYALTAESTKEGYDFVGWYDIANGPENNGTRITEGVMNGDVTVYAGWTSKEYKVSFDLGEYGEMTETEASVYYAKNYKLPTPTVAELTKAFAGWYTQPYGEGFKYTNNLGSSVDTWKDLEGRTLYAHYVNIFTFTLNEDDDNKTYSIAKGDGISLVTKVTIPAIYDGKPVTRIDAEAFARSTSIKEINIPDTVTTITLPIGTTGTGSAFYGCSALQNINVYCACENADEHRKVDSRYASADGILYYNNENSGMSVVGIPNGRTGSLTLPSKVAMLSGEEVTLTTIPTYAFRNIKISEVVIPATVTKIEANAFYAQSDTYANLDSVIFAPAAEGEAEMPLEIMDEAFFGQSELTTLALPARLSEFNTKILDGLNNLKNIEITGTMADGKYASVEGMLTNAAKTEILYVPKARTGKFTINTTSINTIGAYALDNRDGLTAIVIPAHITEIKEGAFNDCDGIQTITFEGTAEDAILNIRKKAFYGVGGGSSSLIKTIDLPANIGVIEQYAFGGIGSINDKRITVNIVAGGAGFANGAFGTDATSPQYYVKEVNIGKDVEDFSIPGVFGATYLEKVSVDDANPYYTTIDNVLYNKDITTIAYFPAGISEYTVPSTVTSIGASLFQGKKDLTKVIIPASVASIGNQAFSGCSNLTQIIFSNEGTAAETLTIGNGAFSSTKISSIDLPVRLTTLGDTVFSSCTNLKTINIPKNVTKIGSTANVVNTFDSIVGLESITVDAENTAYMGINGILYQKNADGKPSALCFAPRSCVLTNNTLDVASTVSKFYNKAFAYNKYISVITFSNGTDGTLTFGTDVFQQSAIREIELPEGLTEIPKNMFYYAQSLRRVNIPTTVTTIANNAFYQCNFLEEITFSDRSNSTTTLTIADASSSSYAPFYRLNSLKKLEFPANTVKIGKYAVYFAYDTDCSIEEIFIPKSVTALGDYALQNCRSVTTLTFEDGIMLDTIPSSAFSGMRSLKSLTIPESVTTIGSSAFSYLGVKELFIPKTVSSIASSAFSSAAMEKVTFEDGIAITSLGGSAFNSCKNLKEITIPVTVTLIGSSCFASCSSLEKVTFETNADGYMNMQKIDSGVFQKTAIKEIYMPETTSETMQIGNNAFQYCRDLEKVTLNGQVTAINQVFTGCPSLKTMVISETNKVLELDKDAISITSGSTIEFVFGHLANTVDRQDFDKFTLQSGVLMIKDGVEEINMRAFAQQTDITAVYIPSTVKKIGNYAFYNCTNLTDVVFYNTRSESSFTEIGEMAFRYCKKLKSINLPSTTKTISRNAFEGCASLEEITIPASVNHSAIATGQNAFAKCTSLHTVNFEENAVLTALATSMFEGCTALKNITIPETVKTVGGSLFKGCTSLEEIHLPSKITSLPASLFSGCTSLKTVTADGAITAVNGSVFLECGALTSLGFSLEKVTTVGASAFKLSGIESINLPKVTSLGANSFQGCANLTSVTLNNALKTIPNYTFADCTALENITLPTGLVKSGSTYPLGTYVFQNCTSLKSISFPDGVVRLQNNSFDGCSSLESIDFNKVTELQGYIFQNCTSLTSVKLPKMTVTGTSIFKGCTSLTDVELSENTKVGPYMFQNCTSLKNVVLPKTNGTNTYLFSGCTALESITLPSSFTTIPNYTFYGCTSLKTVAYEGKVTTINIGVFQGCTALKELPIPATVTTINDNAFNGCTGLEEVELPASVTKIGKSIFNNCPNLKKLTLNNGLTSIGVSAFMGTAIETINIPGTVTTLTAGALNGCDTLTTVIFNNDYFKNVNGVIYNEYDEVVCVLNSATLENGTLVIGEGQGIVKGALIDAAAVTKLVLPASMLGDYSTITSTSQVLRPNAMLANLLEGANCVKEVVLPEGMQTINDKMFLNATSLEKVVIPNTVTKIGTSVFEGCTSLKNVVFHEGLIEIGQFAFRYAGVETVTISKSVEVLGTSIFVGTESLQTVYFPEDGKITEIPGSTFTNSGIQTLELPDCIVKVNNDAFNGCKNLKTIKLSANLAYIGSNAFKGSGLVSITIPGTVTEWYGGNQFESCESLETVVFEEGTYLGLYGSYMFRYCTALKSVTLASSLGDLNSSMFNGCTALKEIYIPDGVIVGISTFDGWTADQKIYTSLSLREAMLAWTEGWNGGNNATLVTDYVPANA